MSVQKISIPKPCHQEWQQMERVNDGRYCDSCCKTVIDFTAMSNTEIIAYISGGNKLCGTFSRHQLPQINNALNVQNNTTFSWKRWVAALSLAGLFNSHPAVAKQPHSLEQIEPDYNNNNKANTPVDTISRVTIKGKITGEDRLPLPAAQLKVKGTEQRTIANSFGYFEMKDIPASGVIIASFIGFETREFQVKTILDNNGMIQLKEPFITGDIVIVKRPSLTKRMWHKIKSIF